MVNLPLLIHGCLVFSDKCCGNFKQNSFSGFKCGNTNSLLLNTLLLESNNGVAKFVKLLCFLFYASLYPSQISYANLDVHKAKSLTKRVTGGRIAKSFEFINKQFEHVNTS